MELRQQAIPLVFVHFDIHADYLIYQKYLEDAGRTPGGGLGSRAVGRECTYLHTVRYIPYCLERDNTLLSRSTYSRLKAYHNMSWSVWT